MKITSNDRSYRQTFSNAYKVLYKEGKLCYLTEILDSAQEAFPHLYVNGEKYVFSKQVIKSGRKLFKKFKHLIRKARDAYLRVSNEDYSHVAVFDTIMDLSEFLEEFDESWVEYEKLYVVELMLIE